MDRRSFLGTSGALLAGLAAMPAFAERPAIARLIVDNDFGGDPDGLFQLAHQLLCPATRTTLIVGTHLQPGSPFDPSNRQARNAADKAKDVLALLDMQTPVIAGGETALASLQDRTSSPATSAVVEEALREDTGEPLIYAAGAGLTEIARAWRADPRIGKRLKLIWIGGNEHAGLGPVLPGPPEVEYNLTIDSLAAQVIFNESDIEIWQVPRNAYRQMLVDIAEIRALASSGPLGAYLHGELEALLGKLDSMPPAVAETLPRTETYVLGDSPLVTLTALQTPFQPDAASSDYVTMPTPRLGPSGEYRANPGGRPMRVYTRIDAGLTFRSMFARIRAHDGRSRSASGA